MPVKPAESLPSADAEIVWDDAGRKWADLTKAEREFLFESHVDDLVRQAHSDAREVLIVHYDPSVTRPPLADDATDGVKAIRKQADKVDELKVQQAAHEADKELLSTPASPIRPERFEPEEFKDHFYAWADDTVEGYVPSATESPGQVYWRIDTGEASSIPGSTRRLMGGRNLGDLPDLADPAALIDARAILDSVKRVFAGTADDMAPSVIAHLEVEVTRLGTLVRTEAQKRAALTAPPDTWISRQIGARARVADAREVYDEAISEIHEAHLTIAGIRKDVGKIPPRNKALSVRSKADEIVYDAFHKPYERTLRTFLQEEITAAGGGSPRAVAHGQMAQGRLGVALAEDVTVDAAEVVMRQILRTFDDLIDEGLMTPEQALARIDPLRGGPRLAGVPDETVHQRLARYLDEVADKRLEEARTIVASAERSALTETVSADDLDEWFDDVMERLTSFWSEGDGAAIAGNEAYVAVQQQLIELAKALTGGTESDVAAVLVGKWSQVGTGGDIRLVINEVLREVRMIGGETFTYETGLTVSGRTSFQTTKIPHVRKALDEMEEAVEEWMPTDWITRSNERGNIGFYEKAGDNRAHYIDGAHRGTGPGDGLINIGSGPLDVNKSTMLHEITHRAQRAVSLHGDLEQQFVVRRVAASPETKRAVRKLDQISPGSQFESYEIAVEDEFIDAYIGKIYEAKTVEAGRLMEVTPMAIQEVSGLPGFSGQAIDADLDMIDWIVGMLAGL